MRKLVAMLGAAPAAPLITDPAVVASEYKRWRFRILYSMFLGYAFFYFTRKSFTFATPALVAALGFDKGQLGILATILSLSYGLSKFLSGIVSDRANARYFMAIGLVLTGVFNICFGLSSSLIWFCVFWGLNGWFQGFGWPPCARLLTHWYSKSERGTWWAAWNVSHNVGGAAIPFIAAFCIEYWGWRSAMFVPGILCILMGLGLVVLLRDTPESLGLPPIEKYRNDADPQQASEKVSIRRMLVDYVLKNKFIWMLAVTYLVVYVVRTGFNDWTVLFLVESKGYSQIGAASCASLFEIGGFCGSIVAGWASDHLFQARRGPVNALFALGILLSVLLFWAVPGGYAFWDSVAVFAIGFTVFGPQMLIGMAAAELSHKKAAATSTGFVGWFAYAGAALAGYPLGRITDDLGWNGFFITMLACSALSLVLLLPLWSVGAAATSSTTNVEEPEPEVA